METLHTLVHILQFRQTFAGLPQNPTDIRRLQRLKEQIQADMTGTLSRVCYVENVLKFSENLIIETSNVHQFI